MTVRRMIGPKVEEKEKLHVTLDLFEAAALREVRRVTWVGRRAAALRARPVRPPRGHFWRRSIISNGSGSHNGGTL